MGICWGSPVDEPNPYPPRPTTISHLSQDASIAISNSSWQTVASTNFTTWISQVSSSLTNLGANNQSSREITDEVLSHGGITAGEHLRVFTYAQLKAATRNFRSDMIVGRGGYGKVYKGGLKEKVPSEGIKKLVIAVKTLDTRSRQGFKEWLAEVNILGSLSHPNLVKLLGYCLEGGKFFLVYEFVQNGSLNYHLFGKGSLRPLPWTVRFKIAKGMARGLAYMHTLDAPIIHRDFKSSNVLLDKCYDAKISDFGLAFLGSAAGTSNLKTSVLGTYGYAPPEFIASGHLYVKSDVYSFGVVLVEMLTGLRATDKRRPKAQIVLVNWVKPYLSNKRKLKKVMDSRLEGKYPYSEASEIAQLAIKCLHNEAHLRPSMKEVAETMERIEASRHKRNRA
ncbi:probable serine/threonine-protein kinase PIX13 [Ricinus communis]|uniref:non-specific serine/threonine protein kinase n=1 Tax=Ricinus communis TaxID=3988 RepID=B9S716_RICCO|nr:probable serine/threonine-protein kinase PIX13 [Ricinus communis]EEF40595.1 serine/threonine-protein kinase cx32, putative [Ricinus communis]|eukprot:XP_002521785.1 probable serine/threonine-protein kinase PIX13 [Ricinus communis]